MATDFIQEQISALLKDAADAVKKRDWAAVRECAQGILAFDPENANGRQLRSG